MISYDLQVVQITVENTIIWGRQHSLHVKRLNSGHFEQKKSEINKVLN